MEPNRTANVYIIILYFISLSILLFKKKNIPIMIMQNFQHHYSSVSQDLSEIILICWFAALENVTYHQCWKHLCCFMFLWKPWCIFQDYLRNKRFNSIYLKEKSFVTLEMSWLSLLVMHLWWINSLLKTLLPHHWLRLEFTCQTSQKECFGSVYSLCNANLLMA